jgi:chromosome partitioning protein
MEKISEISARASAMMETVRDMMLEPEPRKSAPTVNTSRLMELCGVNRARFQYLISKGEIPDAPRQGGNKGRVTTWPLPRRLSANWFRSVSALPALLE